MVGWLIANSLSDRARYATMIASRYPAWTEAELFRKRNAVSLTVAGALPALLSVVPFVNVVTPVFATAYFVYW